jgi:glutathione S-transferase
VKLYYSSGSCSLAAHITIREAKLDVEIERVNTADKVTETGRNFLEVNPKGGVPALELDDGAVLTENVVVLPYLADLAPAAQLIPPDGLARMRVIEALSFIGAELHKTYSPLFRKDIAPAWKAGMLTILDRRLGQLSAMLDSKSYLLGEQFTVADTYAFAVLRWSDRFDIDLGKWPRLIAYRARIAARPAVRQATQEQGLLENA